MTPAQRKMLLIGLLPLLLVVAAGVAVTVGAIRGKLPYSYSAAFEPGADGVRITSDVETHVLTSLDGKVHVTVDGSYADGKPELAVSPADGRLQVQVRCPDPYCKVDLTVELPTDAAVQAKVDQASIEVDGLSSPVTVDANAGSVALVDVRSREVSVDARQGSIALAFQTPPQRLSATASEGSITIDVPPSATYAVDAIAAQGSTDIAVSNDPSSSHHLYLRTSYGSITVR